MKKIYLIVFSLILYLGGFAQNSFPTSNAIWHESIRDEYRTFGLLGDTIINDTVYSKLYQLNDTVFTEENRRDYIGAFRNDEQKVFFKPINWEYQDILLYDFGAEVDDTVWHNAWIPPYFGYNVSDIEPSDDYSIIYSITIENNKRIFNVISSFNPWDNYWIEGIGSNRGILFSLPTNYLMGWNADDFQLNCFKYNDTVEYLNNPNCNECFCPIVDIDKVIIDEINIFPNPTKDILNIKVSESEKIKTISIRSIDGKLIETHQEALTKLNISNLKAGAYIVEIETNKDNFNKLVIKE